MRTARDAGQQFALCLGVTPSSSQARGISNNRSLEGRCAQVSMSFDIRICQLRGDWLNHRRPRVQTGKLWPTRGTSSGSTQSPLALRVPALHRRRMPMSGRSRALRSQQCGSRLGNPPALATLTNTSSHGRALSPPGISRETQLSKKVATTVANCSARPQLRVLIGANTRSFAGCPL